MAKAGCIPLEFQVLTLHRHYAPCQMGYKDIFISHLTGSMYFHIRTWKQDERLDVVQALTGQNARDVLAIGNDVRLDALMLAEQRAFEMLSAIEERGVIRQGRTEREIEQDILNIAQNEFGIEQHWHKRIVRSGGNTLAVFADNPPILEVRNDDVVFVDLGPVFDNWEADIGKTYVIGSNPRKIALVEELERQFDLINRRLNETPSVTGAELFRYACDNAVQAGYRFGGQIAGHIVAEFPHARLPGERQAHHISPANPLPLSDPDPLGNKRHWIIEVHLISPDGSFGGFYERLARPIAEAD